MKTKITLMIAACLVLATGAVAAERGQEYFRDTVEYRGKERVRENFPFLLKSREYGPASDVESFQIVSVEPGKALESRIILEDSSDENPGRYMSQKTEVIKVGVRVDFDSEPYSDSLGYDIVYINFLKDAFQSREMLEIMETQGGFLKNRAKQNRALANRMFSLTTEVVEKLVKVIDREKSIICEVDSYFPCREKLVWKEVPAEFTVMSISKR